jgi:hypothetical protein
MVRNGLRADIRCMRSMRLAGCVAPALAGAILAGCASGRAHRVAPQPTQTGAHTATGSAGARGDVHLTEYTNNDGSRSDVILTGLVGDFGTAQRSSSTDQLQLRLSHGTFGLDLTTLDRRFLARIHDLNVNQRSCSSEATASGPVPITSGSGTGTYATISGTFQLTITLDEVYHPGECREEAPYLAQAVIATGWGQVSIG